MTWYDIVQMKQIEVLPDDVLIEIFHFYKNMSYVPYRPGSKTTTEKWQSLVHVCQRWRRVVFQSRYRLDLRLYCTPETPAKDRLDVWPALPLIVKGSMTLASTDNVIATLGQSSRVYQVDLWNLAGWQLEQVLAAMQVPFQELTAIWLQSDGETPVIPDSFLGGSAPPRLRIFRLSGLPFPALPNLLLSANHLLTLELINIPHSGYISPEAMVALLSALSSLGYLYLGFQSPQSRPDLESRSLPPPKRSILPALDEFYFKGVTKYLEEFVTRIDTPQLDEIHITFFNQIDFDCPRLAQPIDCTPALRACDEAHLQFDDSTASVKLRYRTSKPRHRTSKSTDGVELRIPTSKSGFGNLQISISCGEPDWQLSSIEQICNSSLHLLATVEDLYIEHRYLKLVWKNDAIENNLWLELFVPFTAVENLYLSKVFAQDIAASLQELVEGRITEVLPSLRNIFVEGLESLGPFQENIGQFVAARQLSDHPIAISVWE